MALVAHLRVDLVLLGLLGKCAALIDVVGERLLAEGVHAHADGPDGGRRVVVVGRGDEDDIDFLAVGVEHLAVIVVGLGVGDLALDLLDGLGDLLVVDVAKGDAPLVGGLTRVAAAHAAARYDRNAEFGARRPRTENNRPAEKPQAGRAAGDGGGRLQKVAAIDTDCHLRSLSVRQGL
ncbi:MAG: hypothetical protein NTY65_07950 [Planctomycetota bacterium]|nr:hypothetical protein [Planctomycetota bacterium]